MIVNTGKQRQLLFDRAQRCLGAFVQSDWDWRQGAIGPIDLVPYVGGEPFRSIMNQDFRADRAGYLKIGGPANTPKSPYFFRRYANLLHLLKRQERIHLKGTIEPQPGMVVVLDWPNQRGRFNFSPDRMGIILRCDDRGLEAALPLRNSTGWMVQEHRLSRDGGHEQSIIAYADPPL